MTACIVRIVPLACLKQSDTVRTSCAFQKAAVRHEIEVDY